MRSLTPLAAALLAALAFATHCETPRACVAPGADLDATAPASGEVLPAWAVGAFGHHDIDVANWRLLPSGEVLYVFEGGDYGGGCAHGTARFAGDRVVITFGDQESELVHTTAGKLFLGSAALDGGEADGPCKWLELQPTALCGRDPGGCGGFGSAVACEWDEAVGAACEPDGDAGLDAGAPDAR